MQSTAGISRFITHSERGSDVSRFHGIRFVQTFRWHAGFSYQSWTSITNRELQWGTIRASPVLCNPVQELCNKDFDCEAYHGDVRGDLIQLSIVISETQICRPVTFKNNVLSDWKEHPWYTRPGKQFSFYVKTIYYLFYFARSWDLPRDLFEKDPYKLQYFVPPNCGARSERTSKVITHHG